MANVLGRHVLVEYYGVAYALLDDVHEVETNMLGAARAADATIVQAGFHHFSPIGVSGVVVIQESHLTIHTWPEYGYAAVDIFTCGDTVDPLRAHQFLLEKLKPAKVELTELKRGKVTLVTSPQAGTVPISEGRKPSFHIQRDNWFTTRQKALATSLKLVGNRLLKRQSKRQLIEVYESEIYGKFMALDRQIVISEKDEGYYHEMFVHVSMRDFYQAQSAVVLGGGDGGLVRELLRYANLESIEIIEWDELITEVVEAFFPNLLQALNSPKVRVSHQHIQEWGRMEEPASDVILVDFPLSLLEAESLYHLKKKVHPNGRIIACLPNPLLEQELFWDTWDRCRRVWGVEKLWLGKIAVPTLPGGVQYIAYIGPNPLYFETDGIGKIEGLHVYNDALHRATFALPNDLLKKIKEFSD